MILFDRNFIDRFALKIEPLRRGREHYRVFTSAFLHANFVHLLFNMVTLFFFGPPIERILDIDGFLVIYFGAILTSGIVSFYVQRRNPSYASIGASGGEGPRAGRDHGLCAQQYSLGAPCLCGRR